MPQISCNVTECPYNTQHPSGKGRTCILDILSIYDGLCEFWEAYRESERLDALDAKRGTKNVQL